MCLAESIFQTHFDKVGKFELYCFGSMCMCYLFKKIIYKKPGNIKVYDISLEQRMQDCNKNSSKLCCTF